MDLHPQEAGVTLIDIKPSELPDNPGRISLDTETGTIDDPEGALFPDDGARVADVSIAWHEGDEPKSVAWRFWDEGGHGGALDRAEWDYLCEWLQDRPGIAMMNAPMDVASMYAGTGNGMPGVDLLDLVGWDIGLVANFLDPGTLVSLDAQAKRWFGVSDKATALEPLKKWLAQARRDASKARNAENRRLRKEGKPTLEPTRDELRWASWAYYLAPWELVRPYAAMDAELTIRLARLQWLRLKECEGGPDRWKFVANDREVMKTLIRMERRGIPYDWARSMQVAQQLATRREELYRELPFGDPSPTNLHDWFFVKHQVKPTKLSKITKKPSLDAEVVEGLTQLDTPGAAELGRYKKVDLAEARWYTPFARMTNKTDGRLRPRFKQTAVKTGRLSIQRAQLQAVPHNHVLKNTPVLAEYPTPRDLIPASADGWERWEMDLAQAELRVAALLANARNMLQIIRDGRDPHGELASQTFGVQKGEGDWFKYRQVGKRGNFSLIFGIGKDSLKKDIKTQTRIDLPMPQVVKMIETFRDMHPEFGRRISIESKRVLLDRDAPHVRLINGRKNGIFTYELDRRFDEDGKPYGPPTGMHKAFNRIVQGSIGEFAKAWMVAADEYLMQELAELDPKGEHGLLLQIHDALMISVPEGELGEVLAKNVRQIGIDLWDKWFKIEVNGEERYVPGDIDLGRWNAKG
jgi:DNA polymerase I-like protein with 3'-5' exonuclease and polymerase domains